MTIEGMCRTAKITSHLLARVSPGEKSAALLSVADALWEDRAAILSANQQDLSAAQAAGQSAALLDRLRLDEARLESILADLRRVADLPDPVGEVFEQQTLPNGLRVHKQRVPLGVLAVIYEARPNVTVDVAGLAIKSGNCVILRGGSETILSNRALQHSIRRGLTGTAVPADAVQLIADTDRALVYDLLQMDAFVDMVIPRGGQPCMNSAARTAASR